MMLFLADGLLLLGLLLAPLLYGSVHFLSLLALALLSLVSFNLIFIVRPWALKHFFSSSWAWLGLFILIIALSQIIPCSPELIQRISPALFDFYLKYRAGPAMTLSIYPWDTIVAVIQYLTYGFFFVSILMRLQRIPSDCLEEVHQISWNKSEYLKLGCLTGVLSILFHSIYDFNLHIPANGIYFVVLLALGIGANAKAYDHMFFRRMVEFIIMFGFLISLFAIIQKFSYNGHIFWFGMKAQAPVGPYLNYDHFAGFMELCSALAVSMVVAGVFHTSFFHRRGFVEKLFWFSTSEANKTLRYLAMAAVMISTIFISTSRGGIMSFLLSQIFFFSVVLWAAGRARKQGRFIGIVTTIILFVSVMVVWLGP
ncbi:MAG: hypothetical protein WCI27_03110, partial [Candidatus Omnitrophota bacterium]